MSLVRANYYDLMSIIILKLLKSVGKWVKWHFEFVGKLILLG